MYDKHVYYTHCEGCLQGVPKHHYLGEGGEAKVKIGQNLKMVNLLQLEKLLKLTQMKYPSLNY